MSSAQEAARSIRKLEEEDWAVLQSLEKSISKFESIPLSRIERETHLHVDQLKFRLGRLNLFGFVMSSQYGYILNTAGLDALALNAFVRKGLISGMGTSIGMGKESDVFDVINDTGEESVIKFYRIGRTSFRTTRKTRAYVTPENQHQWLAINIGAAQREAEGLTRAANAGANVPVFIARDRHAVLMSKIEGVMLYKCGREDVQDPVKLLKDILVNLMKVYTKSKIINGDISEYNILFDGLQPWIIDWPQFVSIFHDNAKELLRRDIVNCLLYFRKKFGVQVNTEAAETFVSGQTSRVTIRQT